MIEVEGKAQLERASHKFTNELLSVCTSSASHIPVTQEWSPIKYQYTRSKNHDHWKI